METRKLGQQSLEVSALGLGCMGMSDFYGSRDETESVATINRARDLGVTVFDTADMYGVGANEELVGRPITALQTEYSLWSRDVEDQILPTMRKLGIGFVPYSPLGRGFLTGRFKTPENLDAGDTRRNHSRFQGAAFQKNLDLVTAIGSMAADKG